MCVRAEDEWSRAVVVGAGPVGCLAAISLAKMGWKVDIYEARPGRPPPSPLPWSTFHKYCIHSVDRALLNENLLREASTAPNIRLFFKHRDCSFTCTLFAPTTEFDRLATPQEFLSWFRTHFPDALSILGEEKLLYDYANNPRSALVTIKAKPYHYKDRCVIIGDAAHSMVPFYGQGLNCGFEDVRVLRALLQEGGVTPDVALSELGQEGHTDSRLSNALSNYTETRHEDLVAICELAMYNYVEMRHSVTTPTYLFKKALDNLLYTISSWRNPPQDPVARVASSTAPFPTCRPSGWIPLYTMVTFRPDISYATAKKRAAKQSEILTTTGRLGTVLIGLTALHWTLRRLGLVPYQR
ncbi:hypothetical protein ID866_3889 [Astraeus odoratus]|nr:hypothetical protein ID866_3889 [Astraeus odoratus]